MVQREPGKASTGIETNLQRTLAEALRKPLHEVETEMKMSEKDRLNAAVRHPEYQEDYSKYHRLKNDGKEDEAEAVLWKILLRWNLPHLIPPHPKSWLCFEYQGINPVEVVTSISEDYKPLEVVRPKIPPKNIEIKDYDTYNDWLIYQHEHTSLKGKFLYLRIDITESEPRLFDAFKEIVKIYKSCLPKDHKRKRETGYSPWIVYDMYHHRQFRANKTEITKAISKVELHSDGFNAELKRIERAYKKACAMIKHMGDEASKHPLHTYSLE